MELNNYTQIHKNLQVKFLVSLSSQLLQQARFFLQHFECFLLFAECKKMGRRAKHQKMLPKESDFRFCISLLIFVQQGFQILVLRLEKHEWYRLSHPPIRHQFQRLTLCVRLRHLQLL